MDFLGLRNLTILDDDAVNPPPKTKPGFKRLADIPENVRDL